MNYKKTLTCIAIMAISLPAFTQFKQSIGLSLKASTNGIGGDIYYRPLKQLAIKGGYEYLSYTVNPSILGEYSSINVESNGFSAGMDLGAKFKTGAYSLQIGYQPAKAFYITAGISKFLFNTSIEGTPNRDLAYQGAFSANGLPQISMRGSIDRNKIGIAKIDIKPSNSIAPYVGIGLGSFVPQTKLFSFGFEIGAYFMGAPKINVSTPEGMKFENIEFEGTIADYDIYKDYAKQEFDKFYNEFDSEIQNGRNEVESVVKNISVYPVIKITIGFKAFSWGK